MGATQGWKRGETSSASSVPEDAVPIVRLGFNVLVCAGFGVGLVAVSRLGFSSGLGALSARSGFGVRLVCTCCLPACGFGVGLMWVWRGSGVGLRCPRCGSRAGLAGTRLS